MTEETKPNLDPKVSQAITPIVVFMRAEIRRLNSEITVLQDSIKGLQSVCHHHWMSTGHGHNYEEQECRICLAERHV